MTMLLRPSGAAALAAAAPAAAPARARAVSAVNPIVRAACYIFVASIPFELPRSPLPLELPTLTGMLFLVTTALDLRACYRRVPFALLCFLAWLTVAAVEVPFTTTHPDDAIKYLLLTSQLLFLCWAITNLLGDERTLRGVVWTLLAATFARAVVQVTGIAATTHHVWTGGERVTAFGQNPNLSAIIMSAGLILLVALLVSRRQHLPWPGWAALPAVPLMAFAVIQTGSRGGLICVGVGLLVLVFSGRSLRVRLRNGLLGLLAVAGLLTAAWADVTMRNRLLGNDKIHYFAGRELIYPAVLDMIREKPIFGWGPVENQYEIVQRTRERSRVKRDAHNLVFELMSSTGIVGALPFLMGLLLCLDGAWRARRGPLGLVPLAVLAAVLTGSVMGTWIAGKILWLALSFALAAGLYWRPSALEDRWSRCAV